MDELTETQLELLTLLRAHPDAVLWRETALEPDWEHCVLAQWSRDAALTLHDAWVAAHGASPRIDTVEALEAAGFVVRSVLRDGTRVWRLLDE